MYPFHFLRRQDLPSFSGFISDYPGLEPLDGVANVLVWKAPDAEKRYQAVYFDPPEIFLAADSPYRGIQPEAVKALSDELYDLLVAQAAENGREIADVLGPNVARVRSALTDVYFKRRTGPHRYPFSYSDRLAYVTIRVWT